MTSGTPQRKTPVLMRLNRLPVGTRACIREIQGGQNLSRRLLSLGLRVGSQVGVLHHRGRGVVVVSGGNRIALGGGVAEKLLVEPLTAPDPDPGSDENP
jgi:ferrous iron transport protein A